MTFREEILAEGVRLILGDCREVLASFPPCFRVDAVVSDPPYGVDFKGKTTKHTRATRDFSGGYVDGDNDVGPDVITAALEIADRGVVFPGTRLMFDYPKGQVVLPVPTSGGYLE